MSKILELAKRADSVLIFDIDGVLAPYEYGDTNHNACKDEDWENYIACNNVYETVRSIKTIQEFVMNKDSSKIYVCSVAASYEVELKKQFVVQNYSILEDHIYFVKSKKEKLDLMNYIKEQYHPDLEDKALILIDDTVKTLTDIQENSNYSTMHVSSFLE